MQVETDKRTKIKSEVIEADHDDFATLTHPINPVDEPMLGKVLYSGGGVEPLAFEFASAHTERHGRAASPEVSLSAVVLENDPRESDHVAEQLNLELSNLACQGSELLNRALSSMDEAFFAEVEAEILRREALGEKVDPSNFRELGLDPLGTDWAWAGGSGESTYSGEIAKSWRQVIDVSDEICAEIDAERAACEEAGLPPPDLGGLREEAEDQLGTDWAKASISIELPIQQAPVSVDTHQHIFPLLQASQSPVSLVRELSFIDEVVCSQLEEELLRREESGQEMDSSQFREEGPDPLGIDWAWAGKLVEEP